MIEENFQSIDQENPTEELNASPITFSPEPPILPVESIINGRYKIIDVLGRGGMGTVYKVSDALHQDRELALKSLNGNLATPELISIFKAEFSTMVKLSHPNIARVFDFDQTQEHDHYFFTMEYIAGIDLLEAQGDKHWQSKIDVVVQICRALSYLHSRQIGHFDLKPSNVFVTEEGKIKVLDFGLAGRRPLTLDGKLFGTPAYMAPEMIKSFQSVDQRADQYSLGIMLFELLKGEHPFSNTSKLELMAKQIHEPLPLDSLNEYDVPSWIVKLVDKLTAKEPSDRFRSANEVIIAINDLGKCDYALETKETRESYIFSSKFVGREYELEQVTDFVNTALSGNIDSQSMMNVCAPSGLGKSRLMREVKHQTQLAGANFIECNCYEGTLDEFQPVIECLQQLIAALPGEVKTKLIADYASELKILVPAIVMNELSEQAKEKDYATEVNRIVLLDKIASLCIQATAVVPSVIYFNDLQWAPEGTIDFLAQLNISIEQLHSQNTSVKLGLMGSYRNDEIKHTPVEGLIEQLQQRQTVTTLTLKPLQINDISLLIGSMLGIAKPPERFTQRIYTESQGNPYFIEEMMRVLVQNGSVYLEQGQWAASQDIENLEIPESIDRIFLRRVELLENDDLRYLLEMIAIRGRPTDVSLLAKATGWDVDHLLRQLSVLERHTMLVQVIGEGVRYNCSHDRMREVVVASLSQDALQENHLKFGNALLSKDQDQQHLYDLAYHFWHADEELLAYKYCLLAGDQAFSEYANYISIELYHKVLSFKETIDPVKFLEITEKLGELYTRVGEYEKSLNAYSSVLPLATDITLKARILRKIGETYFSKGDLIKGLDSMWQAAAALGHPRPKNTFAYILSFGWRFFRFLLQKMIPSFLLQTRSPETRIRLLEQSEVLFRIGVASFFYDPVHAFYNAMHASNILDRVGESVKLCHVWSLMGPMLAGMGFKRMSMRYHHRALEMAERLENRWYIGISNEYAGLSSFFVGDLENARLYAKRGRDIFFELGDLFELGVCITHLSYVDFFQGNLSGSVNATTSGLALFERVGSIQMGKSSAVHWALANTKLGKTNGVYERMSQAISECVAVDDKLQLASFKVFMGDMYLTLGEVDRAIEVLEHSITVRERYNLMQDYPVGAYPLLAIAYFEKVRRQNTLSNLYLKLGVKTASKGLLLARLLHPNYLSSSLLAVGIGNWLVNKRRTARRYFKKSLKTAEKFNMGLRKVEMLYESSRCLLEGTEKDRKRAKEQLQKALKMFQDFGMQPYIEKCQQLIDE